MKFSNAMQMKAYMKMEANKLSVTSASFMGCLFFVRIEQKMGAGYNR